jgi:flavorubredoxin
MARVDEIAPDVYRISTYAKSFNLQFCQFLIVDDEPLIYHAGMRRMFDGMRDAVAQIIDPSTVRWIGFSHFEADESGALNEWLELAPQAEPMCSIVGAEVNVNDFASRKARGVADGETFETGKFRWRFLHTPQVPHAWDAGHLFEETQGLLLCSDVLGHDGDVPAITEDDVVELMRGQLTSYRGTPFDDYMPYTPHTTGHIERLAQLEPRVCATMHGSTVRGDGATALRTMDRMLREEFGPPE